MSIQSFLDDLSTSLDKLFEAKHRRLAIVIAVIALLWMWRKTK